MTAFKRFPMKVRKLWVDPSVGMHGYLGALLEDGTQIALCSVEKWEMGPNDSLRQGWINGVKDFHGVKLMYNDLPEEEFRAKGLNEGTKLEVKWLEVIEAENRAK